MTVDVYQVLAPIHNRLPVILGDRDSLEWVSGDQIVHALSLLKHYPPELMEGHGVSKMVNNPQNDSPACVAPTFR